jgi:hypothetical protein
MLIDFLLLLPVTAFLLWLYAYSGPRGLRGRAWLADRWPAVLALFASLAVLVGVHATVDLEGLSLNVIAVVSAYLVLLLGLGLAWFLRWFRTRR